MRNVKWMILPLVVLCGSVLGNRLESDELDSAVWPANWRGDVCNLLDGKNNELFFFVKAKEKGMFDVKLVLDLPKSFSIVAAGCYYAHNGHERDMCALTPMAVTSADIARGDSSYRRHTITLAAGELLPYYFFEKSVSIVIRPSTNSEKECVTYWHLEWNGNMAGKEKSLKTIVFSLPPVVSSPKNIMLMPLRWIGMPCAMPGANACIDDSWGEFIVGVGANAFGYSGTPRDSLVVELGKKRIPIMPYANGVPRLPPDDSKGNWAVDAKGEKVKDVMSPTYFLEHWRGMDKYVRSVKAYASHGDIIGNDYEPFGSTAYSFDNDTVKLFAERERIGVVGLTPQKILSEHKDAWVRFRCWQNARILQTYARCVHDVSANKRLIEMSQPMPPEGILRGELARSGIDVRELDKISEIDAHAPMIYEKSLRKFMDDVGRTVAAVSKPVYPIMLYQMQYTPKEYGGYLTPLGAKKGRQQILGAVAEGAKGVMIWPWEGMDGDDWRYFAQAATEISALEDYFIKGKPAKDFCLVKGLPEREFQIDVPGAKLDVRLPKWSDKLICRSLKLGEECLNVVFNLSPYYKCYCELSFPNIGDGRYFLHNPVDDTALLKSKDDPFFSKEDLRKGVLCFIAEEDVCFYVLKKHVDGVTHKNMVYESQLRSDYGNVRKRNNKVDGTICHDGVTLSWDDTDSDGVPEVMVECPSQKVWVNLSGGRVMRWMVNDVAKELVRWDASVGGLCLDLFQNTAWGGEEKDDYDLISRTVTKECAVISLRKILKNPMLSGLIIEKDYVVWKDKPEIEVRYRVRNEGEQAREVSLWVHNTLGGGGDGKSGVSEPAFVVPCGDKPKFFDNAEDVNCFSASSDVSIQRDSMGTISAGWVATYFPADKDCVVSMMAYDQLSQVYSWRGHPSTCEWMYNRRSLGKNELWQTKCAFIYLNNCEPSSIAQKCASIATDRK